MHLLLRRAAAHLPPTSVIDPTAATTPARPVTGRPTVGTDRPMIDADRPVIDLRDPAPARRPAFRHRPAWPRVIDLRTQSTATPTERPQP